MVYIQRWQRTLNKLQKCKPTADFFEAPSTSKVGAACKLIFNFDIFLTTLRHRKTQSVAAVKEQLSVDPKVTASERADPDYQAPLECPKNKKA